MKMTTHRIILKMYKRIFFATIVLIFLVGIVSAEISINIEVKNSFSLNERTEFSYTISSTYNQNVTFYPYIECQTAPKGFIQEQTIELKSSEDFSGTHKDIEIYDEIEPQTCTAYVQILSPVQVREEKTFEIVTDPGFDFSIDLNKKIFVVGEEVEIDYSSSVDGVVIDAEVIMPDGEVHGIVDLPWKFLAQKVGNYEISFVASKQGYRDVSVKEEFSVIGERVGVKDFDISNVSERKNYLWIVLIGGVILIVIVYLVIKFLKKRK